MTPRHPVRVFCGLLLAFVCAFASAAPSLMENLNRGVVAVRTSATDVFVGWRILGTDPLDVSFDLYRSTGGGAAVKLNGAPITGGTNYTDATADLAQSNAYHVVAYIYGVAQPASEAFTLAAAAPTQQYLRLALQRPAGGTNPSGSYTYSPNDCSVGDVDGDGQYEVFVKWDPSNSKDNSQSGYTGNVYLDCYRLDGTRLWRIDLGINIRAGAHYTQFMVYDLDGDGKAELACKTAPGTKDATGANVILGSDDPNADYRNTSGYVLSGPEYLTIFNGLTGANMATVSYNPPRGTVGNWGDTYGNRVDRFLAGIAYLDGQRPSLVMCRGYYTRACVAAWDWRNGTLSQRWVFDTGHSGGPYSDWKGQGAHSLTIGDVDGDGKDEITYGAAAIDDDGTGLYTTKLGHGDALHMSDMDPDRPGLEVWMVHEDPGSYGPNAAEFRDARTGELIWGVAASGDIGRGLAIDCDPRYRGYEMWGSSATGGMYTAQSSTPNAVNGPRGVQIATGKGSINFACWWDGDLLREMLDGTGITKWNWLSNNSSTLLAPSGIGSNNSTKATPNLSADILGDWREEVIWRETTEDALRIYTTTIPTTHRIHTLMHDRQYRVAIAWQNTAYNQPPHPGFFLGDGMAPVTRPDIVTSLGVLLGPAAPVFTSVSNDTGSSPGDRVTNDNTLLIHGTAAAGATVSVLRTGVGPIGTTVADANGDWTLDYTGTVLPDGTHSFLGTSTVAGQSGPSSVPWSVRIDTVAPVAPTIANIAGNDPLALDGTSEPDNLVSISRTGVGEVASVVSAASGLWAALSGENGLPPGIYSFTAQSFDEAGNASPVSATASVDTTVATPVIASIDNDTGVAADDGITSDNTIVLHGTGGIGNQISLYRLGTGLVGTATVDGSGNWTVDYSATVLPDGVYLFYAVASAGAGSSPNSEFFAVQVDTTAPTVSSINRSNPITALINTSSVTFTVNFSESVIGIEQTDFNLAFTSSAGGAISNLSETDAPSVEVTVGSLTGEGVIQLNVAAGATLIDAAGNALVGPFTTGQTYTRVLNGNGVWINPAGGFWGDNPNWLNSIFPAAAGQSADFNTLNLASDIEVYLDGPRIAGSLIFGDTDTATAGGWLLSDNGSPGNVLTLSGTPTITVNALGTGKVATVDATIAGNQGLIKNGAGTLVLAGTNTFTGTLSVTAGTLRVPANATINTGSGAVNATTTANSTINVTGGTFTAGGQVTAGSGSSATSVAGIFRVDSGTVALNGGFRTGNESGSQLRVTGGTVSTASVNIGRNGGAAADFGSGFVVTGGATTVTSTVQLGTGNSTGAMSVEGGSLVVNGPITVAFQSSGGRGGAMRVTGGTFTSTDTASGIVLSRVHSGGNANNIAAATFTGGTSTVEKIQFGFDSAVNAGSATLTVNGGTLYLGSGGILKNGTAGLVSSIALTSGTLGAKADWSTTHPAVLSAGGTISVRAADAAGTARTITLGGVVSGTGTLTKTGAGTLILSTANTYTGATTINQGTLRVTGSVAATAVAINNGGTLAASGSFGGNVTLHGGGKIASDLASGLAANLTGALTKGSAGVFGLELTASSAPTVGTTYTLANFASTTFVASDFTVTAPAGVLGHVLVSATSLKYIVTGLGASAEFTDWAYLAGLTAGNNGANDDPDGDGVKNLLEFLLARDPLHGDTAGLTPIVVNDGGTDYPGVTFRRRQVVGGVTSEVQAGADLAWGVLIPTTIVSVTSNGDGTDTVVARSTVTLAANPKQFFRLQATLP